MVELSSTERMSTFQSRLNQEADRIRKWKTHAELEISQKVLKPIWKLQLYFQFLHKFLLYECLIILHQVPLLVSHFLWIKSDQIVRASLFIYMVPVSLPTLYSENHQNKIKAFNFYIYPIFTKFKLKKNILHLPTPFSSNFDTGLARVRKKWNPFQDSSKSGKSNFGQEN